ncbi:MAG: hypothetical protein ACR2NT_11760 [Acidimicrobiia bacterium]|nr:hypothetical protein [Acidimicrobiia bacterium]MDQ3500102.1 hypothetical protein [Actinomycetota bacterium]
MEFLIIILVIGLVAVAAVVGGADSRDGADWRKPLAVQLSGQNWHVRN